MAEYPKLQDGWQVKIRGGELGTIEYSNGPGWRPVWHNGAASPAHMTHADFEKFCGEHVLEYSPNGRDWRNYLPQPATAQRDPHGYPVLQPGWQIKTKSGALATLNCRDGKWRPVWHSGLHSDYWEAEAHTVWQRTQVESYSPDGTTWLPYTPEQEEPRFYISDDGKMIWEYPACLAYDDQRRVYSASSDESYISIHRKPLPLPIALTQLVKWGHTPKWERWYHTPGDTLLRYGPEAIFYAEHCRDGTTCYIPESDAIALKYKPISPSEAQAIRDSWTKPEQAKPEPRPEVLWTGEVEGKRYEMVRCPEGNKCDGCCTDEESKLCSTLSDKAKCFQNCGIFRLAATQPAPAPQPATAPDTVMVGFRNGYAYPVSAMTVESHVASPVGQGFDRVSYTRTDLYAKVCRERDEAIRIERQLREMMADQMDKIEAQREQKWQELSQFLAEQRQKWDAIRATAKGGQK